MTSTPRYMGGGDPARGRTDYYPGWLDILADDVTLEGSAMDGAVGYYLHHRGPKRRRTAWRAGPRFGGASSHTQTDHCGPKGICG
jgi:hypothetical protein